MTSTTSRASRRCAAAFLGAALALAGAGRPAAAEAPSTSVTIVRGLENAALAATPGGRMTGKSAGGLGLVVAERIVAGVTWRRILTSDGGAGWTAAPLPARVPVAASAAAAPFTVTKASPDDPAFEENATDLPVTSGANGTIIGATSKARVASVRELMVPLRLRRERWPWLELRFGATSGFAPLDSIRLGWDTGAPSTSLDASLDAAGVGGLVLAPFLGAVTRAVMALAPAPGSRAATMPEGDASPQSAELPAVWSGIDAVYRSGSSTLLVFASPAGHLFRFVDRERVTTDVFAADGEAYPVRVTRVDLNGDGAPEWVLEVCAVNGDGYATSLWVVDGTSRPDHPRLTPLPLSGSSGEGGSDERRTWEIGADASLHVTEHRGKTVAVTHYRYTDHWVRAPN